MSEYELGPPIPPLTVEQIVEHARGIVTGELLQADPVHDPVWQSSLALLLGAPGRIASNLGLILVPKAPHMKGGYWVNGRAPAVTLRAFMVPEESIEALNAEVERMHAALYPETPK